ncbi:hypothetical protein [Sphingomonas asaccharolytica]|uniref:hypothetical protein n=1 Tax=Sphingomonas asaccharolytica TaxID=40681 RepID=UPI000A62E6D4|nr:hypothetical protein [Sphingomonas asaccharolytica]
MTICRLLAIIGAMFIAGLPLTAAAQAQAQGRSSECHLRIEAPVSNWVIHGYDPFGSAPASDEFDLTFYNDGGVACRVRPSFDTDQQPFGLDQGSDPRLRYTLLNRTSNEDVTPRSGRTLASPARPLVVVNPGGSQTLRFGLVVATDDLRTDGRFSQNLRLTAEDEQGGAMASRQLTLGLDVKAAALIGLSGAFTRSEGRALVDLGTLQEGVAPVPLTLYIQSTRGFTVSFESQNNGKLKLTGTDWAIPYGIVVGDRTLVLGGAASYNSSLGTDRARRSVPFRFAIGNVAQKRAGTYSDVITVSIAVN